MTTSYFSALVKNPVLDKSGSQVGRLRDVIVQLAGGDEPLVTAVVVRFGGTDIFVPAADIRSIEGDQVALSTARLDVRPFSRRAGEVLLKQDVLGHRIIDMERALLVRARDISLEQTGEEIRAVGLDVTRHRWFHTEPPTSREWGEFNVLIGHEASVGVRRAGSQLRTLKPAQVADLIEEASKAERNELLTEVASDPDFEADVFEELDEDEINRVLRHRDVERIADSLEHMQTDDAADVLLNLPQERRQAVIDTIEEPRRSEILALLSYQEDSAGGMMSLDQLALPATTLVSDALRRVKSETTRQPQSLTVLFTLDADGVLEGTVPLARLLQADLKATLADIEETDPVTADPDDDIVEIVTRMSDFNLLVLPIVDPDDKLLGAVTVDDALAAAIPGNWRSREASHRSRGDDD